jgi:hypothetical protein
VANREYAFISATRYNRQSFVFLCDDTFAPVMEAHGERDVLVAAGDAPYDFGAAYKGRFRKKRIEEKPSVWGLRWAC